MNNTENRNNTNKISCIELGTCSGKKIFWDPINHETNGHILIPGQSGSGKSYCIQVIMKGLGLNGGRAIILDLSGSLSKSQVEKHFFSDLSNSLDYINAAKDGVVVDLFQRIKLDEETWEEDCDLAGRMVDTLSSFLRNGKSQDGYLYNCIMQVLRYSKVTGDTPNLNMLKAMSINENGKLAQTILNKMNPLFDGNYFNGYSDCTFLGDDKPIKLVQMQSVPFGVKRMLTDILLWSIWSLAVQTGLKENPIFIVIDEFQNANLSAYSPLYKILCEGRKFNINLILATQFIKGKFSSDIETAIDQVGNKIFFRPPDKEIRSIAYELAENALNLKQWEQQLKTLRKGEAIVKADLCFDELGNSHFHQPLKVKIKSL